MWGGAPLPPPPPSRRLIGVVGTIGVVVLGSALAVATGGAPTRAEPPSVDRRMCAAGRAIGAGYGVADTFEESQQRVKALFERYGLAVSGEIAVAARVWSEDIASGDLDLAFHGLIGFTSACSAMGL
jgi:hypothetical protein